LSELRNSELNRILHTVKIIATAAAVAFVVFSCSGNEAKEITDLSILPMQAVDNMFTVQTENGKLKNRMETDRMEHYENDSLKTDLFLGSFAVYNYNDEGLLETILLADKAKHTTRKIKDSEIWEVTGNVSIQNVIKQETMETDTIYWDQSTHQIYTDSYIRMYSKDGYMQGYGMHSDDKAREAVLLKPFNSYSVVVQDTTAVIIDSVNFIGPFREK